MIIFSDSDSDPDPCEPDICRKGTKVKADRNVLFPSRGDEVPSYSEHSSDHKPRAQALESTPERTRPGISLSLADYGRRVPSVDEQQRRELGKPLQQRDHGKHPLPKLKPFVSAESCEKCSNLGPVALQPPTDHSDSPQRHDVEIIIEYHRYLPLRIVHISQLSNSIQRTDVGDWIESSLGFRPVSISLTPAVQEKRTNLAFMTFYRHAYVEFEKTSQAQLCLHLDCKEMDGYQVRVVPLPITAFQDFIPKDRLRRTEVRVGNIDPKVDAAELIPVFEVFGEIQQIRVADIGCRYCTIRFQSYHAADHALDMDGTVVGDRRITVSRRAVLTGKPRHDNPSKKRKRRFSRYR
eukprot:Clim_evm5s67 gene=Clim_evmTU5s67